MTVLIIRAAGGVVWRTTPARHRAMESPELPEVVLVHRPRYDDWTLPKGKLHNHESPLDAAVREVGEEVGAVVAATRRLRSTKYLVPTGVKVVDYWAMRFLGGQFTPSDEVDELAWMAPAEARDRLTYRHDAKVLESFIDGPMIDSVVVLVRHAKAGKRSRWRGEDRLRPLVADGRRQADQLATFARHFRPDRVIAADRVRCEQTVAPLAEQLGLSVELSDEFTDEFYERTPDRTAELLFAVAKQTGVSVICSQGTAIPGLLADLHPNEDPDSFATAKAGVWVLGFSGGELVTTENYPDAAR